MTTVAITGAVATISAGTVVAVGGYGIPAQTPINTNLMYKNLFLSSTPYYSFKTSLNNIQYRIVIRYQTRDTSWYMDLYSADNTPIIVSVKLVPDYPLLKDFILDSLTGFFWLSADVPANKEKFRTDPENIADFFTFRYFYEVTI